MPGTPTISSSRPFIESRRFSPDLTARPSHNGRTNLLSLTLLGSPSPSARPVPHGLKTEQSTHTFPIWEGGGRRSEAGP
ncbi:hypothetical protein HPP92_013451, partial [Vanilla planifolia]